MKNILVTGANGQLGTEIGKIMPNAVLTDYQDLDITNADAVNKFVEKYKIDTIVNCAAYTAVDAAEDDYQNARKINVDGPRNLANTKRTIIHISTDYVFDGLPRIFDRAYRPNDSANPLSIYGWTKRMGEVAVLNPDLPFGERQSIVIRTSWLFSPYGKNFVKTMRNLGAKNSEITVVADQFGKPTYAADLAAAIVQVIPQIKPYVAGIYHYANSNPWENFRELPDCSWYDFATEIMKQSKLKCTVKPITTEQYPTRAARPKYSVLDTTKIEHVFGIKIPSWKDALKRCIAEIERQ